MVAILAGPQLAQPGMVFRGLQLSGVFSDITGSRDVTLLFPVAIPPPPDPLFCLTALCVSWPEFIMPPPPTPVVVLSVNWAPTMLAVPLAALSSPPPLPALLPDRSTWVKAQDARVPDAAAQAGGAPVPDGDAGQAEAPARGDVQDAKAVAVAWLRLITV